MNIIFKSKKLEKICNCQKRLTRKYGQKMAKLIRRRLDELCDADSLSILRTLPQARCHELKGCYSGQLSVDVEHPYRLIFEPADDPPPLKDDGGLDWDKITFIRILVIEDTHG